MSVTDELCFQSCGALDIIACKKKQCSHVNNKDKYTVTIQCVSCYSNTMTNYYYNKAKSKSNFSNYVEKHTKQPMFKFAVPPGKYKITCARKNPGEGLAYVTPSTPQKRWEGYSLWAKIYLLSNAILDL